MKSHQTPIIAHHFVNIVLEFRDIKNKTFCTWRNLQCSRAKHKYFTVSFKVFFSFTNLNRNCSYPCYRESLKTRSFQCFSKYVEQHLLFRVCNQAFLLTGPLDLILFLGSHFCIPLSYFN